MDRKVFYNYIQPRLFAAGFQQSQVDGIEAILDEWFKRDDLDDARYLAYIFATTYWETARTMQPIAEYGKGRGRRYGQPEANGKVYYGRGFVQLTWGYNYKTMGAILGVDLYNNPDLAMDLHIATQILFEGMLRGSFTGKALRHYFTDDKSDWLNARRIINGTDKMQQIAQIALVFFEAIKAADEAYQIEESGIVQEEPAADETA